eukprot:1160531-Pelagomonas_calceolata.AAC.7
MRETFLEGKNYVGTGNPPYINYEKETHWLRRAASPLYPGKGEPFLRNKEDRWGFGGCCLKAEGSLPTSIKEKETLAQKSCESPPPQGYKNKWGSGGSVEAPGSKTWLGLRAAAVPTRHVGGGLQLLSRPRAFTGLEFNQVRMPLVCIQFVRLSHAVSYAKSLWSAMPAA